MHGSAPVGDLPANRVAIPPNVEYWFNGSQKFSFDWSSGFGPEVEFAYRMANKYPNDKIVLSKTSDGARSLYGAFYPTEDPARLAIAGDASWLYGDIAPDLAAATAGKTRAVMTGILWVHGEADANVEICANTYADNLDTFLTAIQADVGPFLWFAGVRLKEVVAGRPYEAAVRQAMTDAPAAQPGDLDSYMLNVDDVGLQGDGVHYDGPAVLAIGERFFTIPPV